MTSKEEIAINCKIADGLVVRGSKGEWRVHGLEDGPTDPYDTKSEAQEDCRGMQSFLRHCHIKSHITTDE